MNAAETYVSALYAQWRDKRDEADKLLAKAQTASRAVYGPEPVATVPPKDVWVIARLLLKAATSVIDLGQVDLDILDQLVDWVIETEEGNTGELPNLDKCIQKAQRVLKDAVEELCDNL